MIYVDTGPFIARYITADQHYSSAIAGWATLESLVESCATSNFVLDECITLLGRRAGHVFAAERAAAILSSRTFTILRPDVKDEYKALQLFRKYADQHVSFTDCISCVLMRKHTIKRVFTFDMHFALAGFEIWKAEG